MTRCESVNYGNILDFIRVSSFNVSDGVPHHCIAHLAASDALMLLFSCSAAPRYFLLICRLENFRNPPLVFKMWL